MSGRLVRAYGDRPRHLLVLLLSFALAAYAVARLVTEVPLPVAARIGLWALGAAVAWDLFLGPLTALADRALVALPSLRGVPLVNHVRVPALLSGVLLLVWAPLVLQRSEAVLRTKAGLGQDVYLGRWLAVSAVLFGASALLLAVRVARRPRVAELPG